MDKQEKALQGLCKLRCRWLQEQRRRKQLVIILVGATHVESSCWQADCCLWQKDKLLEIPWQEGCEAWWQELEHALQDVFIWARVPDMVDTLLILEKELVFREELELPFLSEKQLAMAIQWEAQQLVPWDEGTYHTAFAVGAAVEKRMNVQLWAWPLMQVQQGLALAKGLHLHLQGILAGMSKEKLQQAWYKGYSLKHWSLQEGDFAWQQRVEQLASSDLPKNLGRGCLALSLILYLAAQGACFMASRSLENISQELEQHQLWQQRLAQSQKLETAITQYAKLDKRLGEQATHMGASLQRLGQKVSAGCWLELLRGDAKGKEWQLEGACYGAESLSRLLENMEQDPKLAQVRLLSSQQQRDKLSFSLLVKEK